MNKPSIDIFVEISFLDGASSISTISHSFLYQGIYRVIRWNDDYSMVTFKSMHDGKEYSVKWNEKNINSSVVITEIDSMKALTYAVDNCIMRINDIFDRIGECTC